MKTTTKALTIKKGGKKIGLVVAPSKCKKTWTTNATFFFATGTQVKATSSQKCKK